MEEDDLIQECKSLNSRLVNLCVHRTVSRSHSDASSSTHTRTRVRRVPRFGPPFFSFFFFFLEILAHEWKDFWLEVAAASSRFDSRRPHD